MPMIQAMPTESESKLVEPEDILFDSLGSIFDLKPISVGSLGSSFVYRYDGVKGSKQYLPLTITLQTPDTDSANWQLHASAIWVSSIYLADHISELDIPSFSPPGILATDPVRILELGASAGLPSILISKLFPSASVTVSDYPDDTLIDTLRRNVEANDASQTCRVVPYAWGSDPTPVIERGGCFDIVIAADTLWNPDFHPIFIGSLAKTLKRRHSSRAHLIAGLHTGRYTIQRALEQAKLSGFEIDRLVEREVDGSAVRPWSVNRDGEGDQERRRWVVWAKLKWAEV